MQIQPLADLIQVGATNFAPTNMQNLGHGSTMTKRHFGRQLFLPLFLGR
jgi:hypothetical protein